METGRLALGSEEEISDGKDIEEDEAVRYSRVVDGGWSSGNAAGVGGRARLGDRGGRDTGLDDKVLWWRCFRLPHPPVPTHRDYGRSYFADHSGYRPFPGHASPPFAFVSFLHLPSSPWLRSPGDPSTPTTPPSRTGRMTLSQGSSSLPQTSPPSNALSANSSNARRPACPSKSTNEFRRTGKRMSGERRRSRYYS